IFENCLLFCSIILSNIHLGSNFSFTISVLNCNSLWLDTVTKNPTVSIVDIFTNESFFNTRKVSNCNRSKKQVLASSACLMVSHAAYDGYASTLLQSIVCSSLRSNSCELGNSFWVN